LPINEYRGITLKKKVVDKLEIIAIETKRTVPKLIEHMLEKQYPDLETPENTEA
jgi:predicted DNA-binding ribbon-helix-helix protein